MRIGILTLPLHTNYGGILQSYALQTILERMGHEVVVFQNDYDGIRRFPIGKMFLIWGKRFLRNCIKGKSIPVFMEWKRKRELSVVTQNTHRFINRYIHTYHINGLDEIQSEDFDAIVVGSDQIWRRDYFRRIWKSEITNAYLDFLGAAPIKRIAYAVSFGKDIWNYSEEETEKCRILARKFDAISVREDTAISLCSDNLDVKVEHVLDPTMLLSRQDYIDLIQNAGIPPHSGSLFAYILDKTPEKIRFVNSIAVNRKMEPYFIDYLSTDFSKPIEQRIVPPVESWLRGFYDAELVVTDSFHGCVFSIIFGKPFIAIGNATRGMSRFNSLFKMFALENHMVMDVNVDISKRSYNLSKVLESRVADLQMKSRCFLESVL